MTTNQPDHVDRAAEGIYPGGAVPYGLRVNDLGEWVRVPEEVEIIHEMYALRVRGVSYKAIANRLNARSVPTPKGGEKWSPATVMRILKNQIYRTPAEPPPTLEGFAAIRYARAAQATGILADAPEPLG